MTSMGRVTFRTKGVSIVLWCVLIAISPLALASSEKNLSAEAVRQAMYSPTSRFMPVPLGFSKAELKLLKKQARVRIHSKLIKAWRVTDSSQHVGWFFVDQVIGKHEYITYAMGVGGSGEVKGVEILEYLETHGHEVKDLDWRAQFLGKRLNVDPLRLGNDIDGVSGATLSCRNVTDGIRKLLILRQAMSERLESASAEQ